MNVEHLQERVLDYKNSIETVVAKKTKWNTDTKPLLLKTLKSITAMYAIGWKVQELNWIHNSEAVNISFKSFPAELMDCTNKIPTFQFIPGGALVFSQTYSGDVFIFVLYPEVEGMTMENNIVEFGVMNPSEITAKIIIEKVDDFLKEMIEWEVPNKRTKVGYIPS